MRRGIRYTWNRWYEAHFARWIPAYAFFSLLACFLWNCLIYWGTQQTIEGFGLELHDLTTPLDRQVPFQPAWVSIYVLSFPFWAVSYILTARENSREDWFRFVFADMLAKLICGIIFIIFPTTNIRPEITGDGFWDHLMSLIYHLDPPLDLFPSIHCLTSVMCWLGIRKCERIPHWYRDFTLLFAVMIFASTQFTKQHYLVDILGGTAAAAGCFALSGRCGGFRTVEDFLDRLNLKIFGTEERT